MERPRQAASGTERRGLLRRQKSTAFFTRGSAFSGRRRKMPVHPDAHCMPKSKGGPENLYGDNNENDSLGHQANHDFNILRHIPLNNVPVPTDTLKTVSITPNGHLLAFGGQDCQLTVWDTSLNKVAKVLPSTNCVRSCSFSDDGKLLSYGSDDGVVAVFEVGSWNEIWSAHEGAAIHAVAFSSSRDQPTGVTIAYGGKEKIVRAVRLKDSNDKYVTQHTIRYQFSLRSDVQGIAFSPDGKYILTCGGRKSDGFYLISCGATGEVLKEWSGLGHLFHSVAFSPCNRYFCVGGALKPRGGKVVVRRCSHNGDPDEMPDFSLQNLYKSDDPVYSCDFSPDARKLAIGGEDRWLSIRDVQTGALKHKVDTEDAEGVRACKFSDSGVLAFVGRKTGYVSSAHPKMGLVMKQMTFGGDMGRNGSFSPCGSFLATTTNEAKILIRNVLSGATDATIPLTFIANSCHFSQDSSRIACAGIENSVPKLGIFEITPRRGNLIREMTFDGSTAKTVDFVRFVYENTVAVATNTMFWLYDYAANHIIYVIEFKCAVRSPSISVSNAKVEGDVKYASKVVTIVYYRKHKQKSPKAKWCMVAEQIVLTSLVQSTSEKIGHTKELSPLPPKFYVERKDEWNSTGEPRVIDISNCGNYVACSTKEKTVTMYAKGNGEWTALWERRHDHPKECRFSNNGKYVACVSKPTSTTAEMPSGISDKPSMSVRSAMDGDLLHHFSLKSSFRFCQFYKDSVVACCADDGVSFWNVSADVDPLPHECTIEQFFSHYIKKRPHLIYRGDYDRVKGIEAMVEAEFSATPRQTGQLHLTECVDEFEGCSKDFEQTSVSSGSEVSWCLRPWKAALKSIKQIDPDDSGMSKLDHAPGSTILHRLVKEGTHQDLQECLEIFRQSVADVYCIDTDMRHSSIRLDSRNQGERRHEMRARGVWPLLPVEDFEGRTPLCLAVEARDVKKIQLLLDYFSVDFSVFDADLPAYTKALTSDYLCSVSSDLTAYLLEKSVVRLKGVDTANLHVTRPRLLPCQSFVPTSSFWADVETDVDGYQIEPEVYVVGYANFITLGGTFDSIVRNRSGNLQVFESEAMKYAIQYKWELYGEKYHQFLTFLFTVMCISFGFADAWPGSRMSFAALSNVCGVLLLLKEFLEAQGSFARYVNEYRNLFDLVVIVMVFILNMAIIGRFEPSSQVKIDIWRAVTYLIMAIDMLNYLRPYRNFGAFISMIDQILVDMGPFMVVVLLFVVAVWAAFSAITQSKLPATAFYVIFQLAFGGGYETEDFTVESDSRRNIAVKLLLLFYLLINVVILLNLLIAIMSDSYDKVRENEMVSKASNRASILNDIDNSFGWTLARLWPKTATKFYPRYLHVLTNRVLRNPQSVDLENWEGGVKELKNAVKVETKKTYAALSSAIGILKSEMKVASRKEQSGETNLGQRISRLEKTIEELVNKLHSK